MRKVHPGQLQLGLGTEPHVEASRIMVDQYDTKLMRIVLPHAVFGLVVRDGLVIEAAPIASWARGNGIETVTTYFRKRFGERFSGEWV